MSTQTTIGGKEIIERVMALGDEEVAGFSQRYFKTGEGEYGHGDRFVGIRAPLLRKLAREYQAISPDETLTLLRSPVHEVRALALLILTRAYERGDATAKGNVYRLYLDNTRHVNNWDLVDCSAPGIVGAHLAGGSTRPLVRLAKSSSIWERRIAIIATLFFIRRGEYDSTLELARLLLNDREDLIHKATGWMLREVGKRDQEALEGFLREHHGRMPRTMLRYAIERFPQALRKRYLEGKI
jgi:3-methyladenine DNA glycosylase AlkD